MKSCGLQPELKHKIRTRITRLGVNKPWWELGYLGVSILVLQLCPGPGHIPVPGATVRPVPAEGQTREEAHSQPGAGEYSSVFAATGK